MPKKKKHTSQPRFHRMKRAARLNSAKAWLTKYDGKNVVRGYRNRYGVDLLCAITELQMLKVHLDAVYIERVRTTVQNQIIRKAAKRRQLPSIPYWKQTLSAPISPVTPKAARHMDSPGKNMRTLIMTPSTTLTSRSDQAPTISPKNVYLQYANSHTSFYPVLLVGQSIGHDDS
jgi:hypothetical protein